MVGKGKGIDVIYILHFFDIILFCVTGWLIMANQHEKD